MGRAQGKPINRPQPPAPLDPAVLRVIEALARSDARRDYAARARESQRKP